MSVTPEAPALPTLSERTRRLRDFHMRHLETIARQEHDLREIIRFRAIRDCPDDMSHHTKAEIGYRAMFDAMPVVIHDDDLIAGHYGSVRHLFEGVDVQTETNRCFEEACVPSRETVLDPELRERLALLHRLGAPVEGGVNAAGHHLPDYEQIFEKGLLGMADEADAFADGHDDPEKAAASRSMGGTLRLVVEWMGRHADRADTLAADAAPGRAAELRAMAEACRNVGRPPKTMRDAAQTLWLVFLCLNVTDISSANSCGRLDRLLRPFYEADLASGRLTREEAYDIIAHLLLKYCGSSRGQALTLGGRLPDGSDAACEVTRLVLRAAAELAVGEPIIALFVHEDTEEEILDLAAEVTRRAGGQLSYYAWDHARAMLAARPAVRPEDHDRVAVNSCMGVVPAGREISHMWGGVVFLPSALEIALDGGRGRNGERHDGVADRCREADEYTSVDEIFDAWAPVTTEMLECVAERFRAHRPWLSRWWTNPFVSGVVEDCRRRGLDRLLGGARHHSVICEAFGWANMSDSLIVIEDLVFDRGVVSLSELLAAARNDWADRPDLLRMARARPKYGNGDERADAMARRVLERYCDLVEALRRPGEHAEYLPSLHTHGSSGVRGEKSPVSLDGRRYGAALNKQTGPSSWAATAGPTAVVTSAARMPTERLSGGQALDLSVPPDMLETDAGRANFRALLRTYFRLGGGQAQVNCVSVETLRAAKAKPEDHWDLLIRVGGHSDHFVRLGAGIQDDLIERIGAGL